MQDKTRLSQLLSERADFADKGSTSDLNFPDFWKRLTQCHMENYTPKKMEINSRRISKVGVVVKGVP